LDEHEERLARGCVETHRGRRSRQTGRILEYQSSGGIEDLDLTVDEAANGCDELDVDLTCAGGNELEEIAIARVADLGGNGACAGSAREPDCRSVVDLAAVRVVVGTRSAPAAGESGDNVDGVRADRRSTRRAIAGRDEDKELLVRRGSVEDDLGRVAIAV